MNSHGALTAAQWLAVLAILDCHCLNPALIAAVEAAAQTHKETTS